MVDVLFAGLKRNLNENLRKKKKGEEGEEGRVDSMHPAK